MGRRLYLHPVSPTHTPTIAYTIRVHPRRPFGASVEYLGFMKYLALVDKVLTQRSQNGAWWTLADAEKLTGYLGHIQIAIRGGRAHTQSLWQDLVKMDGYGQDNLARSNKLSQAHHRMSGRAHKDLQWWRQILGTEHIGTTLRLAPDPSKSWNVWTDASDWGLGVVINDTWQRWKLAPGWRTDGCDIGWAEATAVEVAVRILTHHFVVRETHILIRCDNIGVIDGWRKGASKSVSQNDSFSRKPRRRPLTRSRWTG